MTTSGEVSRFSIPKVVDPDALIISAHQMMSDYWAAPFIGFLIIVIIMSICSWICRMTKWREDQEYVPRQLYGCGAPDFSDSLRERHPNGFLGSDGIFYVNETTRQQPYTASHGHYLLPSMRQPPPPTPSAPTPTTPPSTSQIAGVHQVLRAPSEDLPPAYDECVVVK